MKIFESLNKTIKKSNQKYEANCYDETIEEKYKS